jgi:glycine cleavage system aminomethyltransferase T
MIVRSLLCDRPVSFTPVDIPPRSVIATGSVPATCLAAGAQLGERDGRVVVALYGSTPGEIAACMTRVGLADRSDLGTLELRGPQSSLDRAFSARFGDPPVAPGTARRERGIWYLRLEPRRALVVGPHAQLAAVSPVGAGSDRAQLRSKDIGATLAMISVIGPRAARLLSAAALPASLPIGAVGRDPADARIVAILRESQRRVLVLAQAPAVDGVWGRLLEVGEPLGAAFVGCDALSLLGAATAQAPG